MKIGATQVKKIDECLTRVEFEYEGHNMRVYIHTDSGMVSTYGNKMKVLCHNDDCVSVYDGTGSF